MSSFTPFRSKCQMGGERWRSHGTRAVFHVSGRVERTHARTMFMAKLEYRRRWRHSPLGLPTRSDTRRYGTRRSVYYSSTACGTRSAAGARHSDCGVSKGRRMGASFPGACCSTVTHARCSDFNDCLGERIEELQSIRPGCNIATAACQCMGDLRTSSYCSLQLAVVVYARGTFGKYI